MSENKKNITPGGLDEAANKVIAEKDEQISNLLKDQEALKLENGNLLADNQDLKNQLDDANAEVATLKADNSNLSNLCGELESERDKAEELMTEMSKSLTKAQIAVKNGFQTVDHDGKTYGIHGKVFFFEGKEFTADQLLEDSELVGRLVKIGAGFLKEVKED
ncbi:hypothetical protein [Sphingobacterium detergens]